MSVRSVVRPVGGAACVAAAACAVLLSGCATWNKLTNGKKLEEERRKYGATADQRIESLAADATKAKAAGHHQEIEFTQGLAKSMLEEHDPRVRCAILETAATFDTPSATAICKGALEDPDERVRMAACSAWATRGGPEAVELLAQRYRTDREVDVRLRALRELGHLGDKGAIPVLAKALEDPDPAAQYRAVGALKKVSGRDLGDDVNKWREWAADPDGSSAEWSIAEGFRQIF
jgi:HEAT repeat protein